MFDRLMLLSMGTVAYHGASSDALPFFSSVGKPCPTSFNPADFFLDAVDAPADLSVADLVGTDANSEHGVAARRRRYADAMSERFEKSQFAKADRGVLERLGHPNGQGPPKLLAAPRQPLHDNGGCCTGERYATPHWYQVVVLMQRTVLAAARNPQVVGQQVGGYLVTAAFLSLLFGDIQQDEFHQVTLEICFLMSTHGIFAFFATPS